MVAVIPFLNEGEDFFCEISTNHQQLSLLVGRKKSRSGFSPQTVTELISISSAEIFSALLRQRVQKKGNKVCLALGVLSITFGVSEHTNSEDPRPTTEGLSNQCPRFRILVIGKSGVGCSTLINRVFGVEPTYIAGGSSQKEVSGNEFISARNDRLVLHFFKPVKGYDEVEAFIERRGCMSDVKDQLHAVWLCFQTPIPIYGERLLSEDAEGFLQISKKILGNTPTIIVFTKYDQLASYTQQRRRTPEAEKQLLQEYCIQPIQYFTGDERIAHIAVSIESKYEQSLEGLIRLTQKKVSESFTSPEGRVSPVSLAAAKALRYIPALKVDSLIDVAKQRYRKALNTCAKLRVYTMQVCLGDIHTDIVTVWDFCDPCRYLYSDHFRNLMRNMVEKVDASVRLTRSDTFSGTPLLILSPVVLPFAAGLAVAEWVHDIYQRLQGVPTTFMAYIVDLTHVLEVLFSLTAVTRPKKLTRRAIRLASSHCPSTARDMVLEKITSIISSDDSEFRMSRVLESVPSVDLEVDEEWRESVSQ
ncbi:hypothetical protein EDD17DRAFT_62496 [Pisolithus thermaeus]|nr:hypothetical protein EDD17DRAFT_62496 [Pisolithus thermaeus]